MFAFADCSKLNGITIPNSVTTISPYAFQNCTELTMIIIPDSVTSLGGYVFTGCSRLTYVVLPKGINNILVNTFSDTALKKVFFRGSYADWDKLKPQDGNAPLFRAELVYDFTDAAIPCEHTWQNGSCSICGESDPNAPKPSETPTGPSDGATNQAPGSPVASQPTVAPTQPAGERTENARGNGTALTFVLGIVLGGCAVAAAFIAVIKREALLRLLKTIKSFFAKTVKPYICTQLPTILRKIWKKCLHFLKNPLQK